MSAIVGIFHRHGEPVEEELLARLLEQLHVWGGDGAGLAVEGSVGLGHALRAGTPEATQERQPIRSGSVLAVVDARVDNRQELVDELRLPLEGAAPTDAKLVVAAYERWGADFPNRLLGEVAAIIWDAEARSFFCVRDRLGLRPLHWTQLGSLVVACTDLGALTTIRGVDLEPDEEFVAGHLTGWLETETGTPYRGISRVPQAHVLRAAREGVSARRYWHPSFEGTDTRPAAEQVDEYRELLDEAVRCRMRTTAPCAVSLSGGIDSSSVATLAWRHSQAQGGTPAVEGCSMVFPGFREADESSFIRQTSEWTGLPSRTVRLRPRSLEDLDEEARITRDLPNGPTGRFDAILGPADAHRRVFLTGNGGDELFIASPLLLAELLRQGRLVSYGRALREMIRCGLLSGPRAAVIGATARPLLEQRIPGFFRRRDARGRTATILQREFARRLEPAAAPRNQPPEVRPAARVRLSTFYGGEATINFERLARRAAHHGVEMRYPFLDLRMIEFALRLPEDVRLRDGGFRWIQREAMRGLLPEAVRNRRLKAEFSVIVREELAALGGRSAFEGPLAVVDRGWVDRGATLALYDLLAPPGGPAIDATGEPSAVAHVLWNVIALERWIRTVDSAAVDG